MKRVWATLVTTGVLLGLGCSQSYDLRMDTTLNKMRYRKRLDDNLIPAISEGPFKDLQIYLRPPKPLEQSSQFFGTVFPVEPGQFDLTTSFLDSTPEKAANKALKLHVLARRKAARAAAKKGQPAEPPAARAPFESDVLALLGTGYAGAEGLTPENMKSVSFKKNQFKRLVFKSPQGTDINAYFYKSEPYEVALIFDTSGSSNAAAITLCLESFAVGQKAAAAFDTGYSDDEPEAGAEGVGTPTVF